MLAATRIIRAQKGWLTLQTKCQPLLPLLGASTGQPLMPSKPLFPNFARLGFMGLIHESITYVFSNKINYLVEYFMSLEVLVIVSLSCDQNLEKKGIFCPLAFRCQPSLWYYSRQSWQWQRGWWDKWPAPNLVWELDCFLRCSPIEGRTKWGSLVRSVWTHGLFWLRFHVRLSHEGRVFWWASDLVVLSTWAYPFSFSLWALRIGQSYYILPWIFIPHKL